MNNKSTLVVIGAGAAGFFGAITAAEANPACKVLLLEKAKQVLAKVRISGGGRCNVTHACFDPAALIQNYPRGSKALRGPFTRFQPKDTIEWFESRGVHLKTEADGRMFPVTDSSETIIDCLRRSAEKAGVELRTECGVQGIKREKDKFVIDVANGEAIVCDKLLIATGSTPKMAALIEGLGHTLVPAVPSLFTFNIPDSPLVELSGIAVPKVHLRILETPLEQTGPLLITHWGFSGPAVLKLSAWGARILHDLNYEAVLSINWIPEYNEEKLRLYLLDYKRVNSARLVGSEAPVALPKNLWKKFTAELNMRWSEISKKQMQVLIEKLLKDTYRIKGKTTFKEEFVTCGGVSLGEVDFKTMESRVCPGLYFAGEVLDIDGVTGGFNFQNAWTTAWIAGHAMAR